MLRQKGSVASAASVAAFRPARRARPAASLSANTAHKGLSGSPHTTRPPGVTPSRSVSVTSIMGFLSAINRPKQASPLAATGHHAGRKGRTPLWEASRWAKLFRRSVAEGAASHQGRRSVAERAASHKERRSVAERAVPPTRDDVRSPRGLASHQGRRSVPEGAILPPGTAMRWESVAHKRSPCGAP